MRTVDLFCGCGGMSLGFQNAGYDVLAAFDNWDRAIEVYKHNFSHDVYKKDLSDEECTVQLIKKYNPRIIIGGPPCQDFSSAGKRNEDNGRGDLTINFANIVAACNPEFFVMENVARIRNTRKLAIARSILQNAGYGLTECVLDASLCGVPQSRKRFFLIGRVGESHDFLLPFIKNGLSRKHLTLRDFLGDEMNFEYYYRHPRSYARRGIFSIDEPSPTIRGVNRPMPKGYPGHPGDPVKDLSEIRELSTELRSRIQTFPVSFNFIGNKTEKEQMIGNAVPVNLARFVGEIIKKYLAYMERDNFVPFEKKIYHYDDVQPLMLFDESGRYC